MFYAIATALDENQVGDAALSSTFFISFVGLVLLLRR